MILHNSFSGVFLFSDGYDSPCCKNCTYHNTKGMKCRDADTARCKKESYCNGKEATCPDPEPMSDGTECIDRLVFLWSGTSTRKFNVRVAVSWGGEAQGLGSSQSRGLLLGGCSIPFLQHT